MANEEYIHPSRYNKGGIEVWEIEKAYAADRNASVPAFVEHLRFGALEYILRCWDKNGIEDLRKAANLLTRAVEELAPGSGDVRARSFAEMLAKKNLDECRNVFGEIHAKEEG